MARPIVLVALAITAFAAMSFADASHPAETPYLPIQTGDERHHGQVIVEVEPGDHLWGLSAGRLDQLLDRKPTDSEITPFWREVISLNLKHLRSGDPDLIYPGERVVLPGPTSG